MLKPLLFLISATPLLVLAAEPKPEPDTDPQPTAAPTRTIKPAIPLRSELVQLIAQEAMAMQDADREQEKAKEKTEAPATPLGVFSAGGKSDKYAVFARKFAEARVPSCIGPDALKFNPPVIAEIPGFGPIMAGGMYALPWLVAAKLKGKCN